MSTQPLIAVDIGNARIKFGRFADVCASGLPEPLGTLSLADDSPDFEQLAAWLSENTQLSDGTSGGFSWWIASVNRPAATRLIDWLRGHRPDDRVVLLACDDLPLVVRLERPDMVGIDRLVDAVAVNRIRFSDRPAVIVDVGSAITVDWISAEGEFFGGAILPGIAMSARALHDFTDLLPLVSDADLTSPPPALGVSTITAMQSGLFWGAVGSIRELVAQLSRRTNATPRVFLTGGAGRAVAELLGESTSYEPNLTLAGIALTAMKSH